MPSIDPLKRRLAKTLRAKNLDAALAVIADLRLAEPDNSVWPKRAARLFAAKSRVTDQMDSLRQARELEVDQGLVLEAIATCKALLEIDPSDTESLDCLDLLYLNSGPRSSVKSTKSDELDDGSGASHESFNLADRLPGVRSVQLGNAMPGSVHEIPVDDSQSAVVVGESSCVDLRLEEWTSGDSLEAIAAAQNASLPLPTQRERNDPGHSSRGASLRAQLANVPLFGDLEPASLHTLIRKVRVVELGAGQILFRQGDPANSLYIIVEGAVVPIAEGERRRKLAVLERGEFFGEIGLMAKQPRNATIEALVDTKLLAIDRRILWELIDQAPSVAHCILRFLRARLIDRQIRTNLFFAAFALGEREAVAKQFRVLEVAEGTRMIEKGQPPEGLFVVLSGDLSLRDPETDKDLGGLVAGDVFGGLSLIEGQPASADVTTVGKCWLIVLGEARFRRIVEANPRLVRVLRRSEPRFFAESKAV